MRNFFIAIATYATGWGILLFGLMLLLALVNPYPVEPMFTVVMAIGLVLSILVFILLIKGKGRKDKPSAVQNSADITVVIALKQFRDRQPITQVCHVCKGLLSASQTSIEGKQSVVIRCKCGKCSGTYQFTSTNV